MVRPWREVEEAIVALYYTLTRLYYEYPLPWREVDELGEDRLDILGGTQVHVGFLGHALVHFDCEVRVEPSDALEV